MTKASDPRRRAPGAGRKARASVVADVAAKTYLTPDEKARLHTVAAARGCSESELIRTVLQGTGIFAGPIVGLAGLVVSLTPVAPNEDT